MAACRRNPQGWADLRRRAALLVVDDAAPACIAFLLAPCAARS